MKRIVITEALFIAIKSLLDTGATYAEVEKYYKVSVSTSKRIKDSANYAEYKQMLAAMSIAYKEKYAGNRKKSKPEEEKPVTQEPVDKAPTTQIVEHRQSVTIQATHYMMQEMQETNKLLKDISNKLAFIVEQLS